MMERPELAEGEAAFTDLGMQELSDRLGPFVERLEEELLARGGG